MTNNVLLNNIDHQDLKVAPRHGPEFGDSVNQMLIFPTEFEEVQREFPILFRKDENGDFQAVALLGLDKDENLFLEESGWRSRYVPAIQRRGPFSIGLQQQESAEGVRVDPMIHIDLDDPRVGREEGQPLFLPHGGNAPYLDHMANVLRALHHGLVASKPMIAAFEEAGLLGPVRIEINLNETEKYAFPNHYVIDEEKLSKLDAETLGRLHDSGFLYAAFLGVASLGNVGRLIDLKNRKRTAA